MRMLSRKPVPITRMLVAPGDQLAVTEELFGVPFRLEMVTRGFVMTMTQKYCVSNWQFYLLDNGGCYVAPTPDKPYRVIGLTRPLSAEAIGLVSSMLALSSLCFSIDLRFAERSDTAYSHLREFILQRPEGPAILAIAS
jgi:hypothetical protein